MNHTCSAPNVKLFHTLRDHRDTNFVHVGFEAELFIPPGTELLFNYGDKPEGCRCAGCCRERELRRPQGGKYGSKQVAMLKI